MSSTFKEQNERRKKKKMMMKKKKMTKEKKLRWMKRTVPWTYHVPPSRGSECLDGVDLPLLHARRLAPLAYGHGLARMDLVRADRMPR